LKFKFTSITSQAQIPVSYFGKLGLDFVLLKFRD
jgi:hypothetical protein